MIILKKYFTLQLSMLKKQLFDFGVNPSIGFIVILSVFYVCSIYLFTKTAYASYLYILIAIGMVLKNSEVNRTDFLKFTFTRKDYFKIRILENLLTVLPFIIFLCFKKEAYSILLLLALSVVIALLNTPKQIAFTLPTPFYKKPFEFIVGFRMYWGILLIAYFIATMSIMYQNFNLGIFSLLLIYLVCLSFYNNPENEFYVWVHKLNVTSFLIDKITTAIIFSTLLSLPITIALLFFFTTNSNIIIGFQALGYCYLLTIILAKYAAYPQKINLPQGILLAVSLTMPPLLLIVAPYFYIQSNKKLKAILE
jgi:hypothetical protein